MNRSPVRRYLYFAVFAAGMTTLAVELSASRLLGNVFGTSNLVWASIIGLILIYLTAGYFLGGRWADRSPRPQIMYSVMAWGAFLIGVAAVVAAPVLRVAADAFDQLQLGILFGSFAGVLILFSLPVTLLGTISPFAIRLAISDAEHAGTVSGRIYAIATLGSFVGTFLPVLVFIPTIGTTRTFLAFSLFLTLVAIVGMGLSVSWKMALAWAWMPVLIIIFALSGWRAGIKTAAGQIYESESAYNYIQVIERDGYRYLRLNEGQGVHSAYHPTEVMFYGPWLEFLAAPFFNLPPFSPREVDSLAIVGLAAGTTARLATAAFGPILIDGFEIDPEIIEVGRAYFDMNLPNLNANALDGRWGLEHSQRRYSIIAVDAYRPPYIPWHLTTREFFANAKEHLQVDGVLAINVGRAPEDRRLVAAMTSTLLAVFPSVHLADVPGTYNTIIYATNQPTAPEYLHQNLMRLFQEAGTSPVLLEALKIAALNLQPVPVSETVFTDDLAPVEWITNNMVLRFLLFGDLEAVQ
jgi:spermidine synthase